MGKSAKNIFLVCTGLGKVQRGFEIYIQSLAEKLTVEFKDLNVKVFAGGKLKAQTFDAVRVFNLSRNNPVLRKMFSSNTMFAIEQISFFFFFLPSILLRRPHTVYLGEYRLYCYLFKARNFFNLDFSLVLYTGGQASPGLFDPKKDYVHHITDIYYKDLIQKGVPAERQFVIPHFLNTDFDVDKNLMNQLKSRASEKKIVLSVGSIDKTVKRMHLIPIVLGDHADSIFPIILGEWSNESDEIKQFMKERFGADGFIMDKINRRELGSYYTAADAFILCSKKESFGLVFLEAMFFGIPVICHDFYESRWVLKDNAHFMDMDGIDSFKREFSLLLPSLNKQPALNLFVKKNYIWTVLKESYKRMFDEILKDEAVIS
jgi:1,2-diacylglycerol 3-alpha-glucosyltransferase